MKWNNRYITVIIGISSLIALLIYFPEWLSLVGPANNTVQDAFPDITLVQVLNEAFFTFISLLILFFFNSVILHYHENRVKITWMKIMLSFVVTWFISTMLSQLFMLLHQQLDLPAIHSTVHFFLHPLRDLVISITVCVICYLIYITNKHHMVQVENQQLHAENLLNQYEALKNQLNPHMLFNSLNTLRSLIRDAPEKAQDYLQELSYVLRYTLKNDEGKSVTLREEMDFVNAYVFLLKMRYEDNLHFEADIPEEMESRLLPPISIQILIENAVKHNEISNRKPLFIRINAGKEWLVVTNPVQSKLTPSRGTGIGLYNLAKRYKLLYQKEILIREVNGIFSVTLPLI